MAWDYLNKSDPEMPTEVSEDEIYDGPTEGGPPFKGSILSNIEALLERCHLHVDRLEDRIKLLIGKDFALVDTTAADNIGGVIGNMEIMVQDLELRLERVDHFINSL